MNAPAWVVDAMRRQGLPDPQRGVVTTHRRERATARWCRCGQPVWSGLADREDVALDPTPTTPDGELFAIMAGRRTFEKDMHGIMCRRRPANIRAHPADAVRVYIAHACSGPHAIPNSLWAPVPVSLSDVPPF